MTKKAIDYYVSLEPCDNYGHMTRDEEAKAYDEEAHSIEVETHAGPTQD